VAEAERPSPAFAAAIALLAYVVMLSYALARPPSESLFLEAYGSGALPLVWLAVAIGAALAVTAYSRAAGLWPIHLVLGGAAASSAAILVAVLAAMSFDIPGARFVLYVWKDVYIVVLVEIFWSIANVLFPIRTARWAYGFFLLSGSLGGVTGNLGVGRFAQSFGSRGALWLIPPLLVLVTLASGLFARFEVLKTAPRSKERASFVEAWRVVQKSAYLGLLAIAVAVVQVVATLIDFEYSAMLERSFPATDERTAVIGRVYAAIDAGSMLLQVLTGPILRLIAVPPALLGIPLVLGSVLGGFLVMPRFWTIALAKIAGKCLDYSLFRAAKEILYIPLEYAEKTRGKSIVDMLTYRVAKGGASLLLMILSALGATALAGTLALALVAIWWTLMLVIGRRFRRIVSREEELSGQR
jgi:ATP:ADP antiporter, AAA family